MYIFFALEKDSEKRISIHGKNIIAFRIFYVHIFIDFIYSFL